MIDWGAKVRAATQDLDVRVLDDGSVLVAKGDVLLRLNKFEARKVAEAVNARDAAAYRAMFEDRDRDPGRDITAAAGGGVGS